MPRILTSTKKRLLKILIIYGGIVGCGQNAYYAPVHDSAQPPSQKVSHHVVAKGETLYSIAWRYNLDYRKLAAANGIARDFRIYPGQRIELKEAVIRPVAVKKPDVAPQTAVRKQKKTPVSAPRSKKATPKPSARPSLAINKFDNTWIWPARGKLVGSFYSNNGLNKGIDIQGNLEEPILSAAAGKVVYSGDGLRGYGKLIIVKHNDKYLSAYAHNHRLLVREGAVVEQGQKIAEMGSSGTDSVKLHFEIRHDGKPVDPLKHLPRR